MWHNLSSDQELLRDTTARFLTDRVPLSRQRKELRYDPAGFEPAYWTAGAELGWTMLLVGEEAGGGSVSGRGAGTAGRLQRCRFGPGRRNGRTASGCAR
jgi:alkylation response protein AidB-like acyl-CoA dehydrogenase